jgi:hypothetical protein
VGEVDFGDEFGEGLLGGDDGLLAEVEVKGLKAQ